MADRTRRGMLITNNVTETIQVFVCSRQLCLEHGDEAFLRPDEVRDSQFRTVLQERSISIVRPATPAEAASL